MSKNISNLYKRRFSIYKLLYSTSTFVISTYTLSFRPTLCHFDCSVAEWRNLTRCHFERSREISTI